MLFVYTNAVPDEVLLCDSIELLLLTWMDCSKAACQAFISAGNLKDITSIVCHTLTDDFGWVSLIAGLNTHH